MATTETTTRRSFWRSTLAMWIIWAFLGLLLIAGFSLVSAYPSLIHLVQAGTLGTFSS